MTPEAREAWYSERRAKIAQSREQKKRLSNLSSAEALERLPFMIEESLEGMEDKDRHPTENTLHAIAAFLEKGYSHQEVRDELLKRSLITIAGWDRLKKILFEKVIARAEDMSLNILQKQRIALDTLENQLHKLHALQAKSPSDLRIVREIRETAAELMRVQGRAAEIMSDLGAVGEKNKKNRASGITIINKIPRPVLQPRDVTPKTIEIEVETAD